jgi:Family of unknown function (DUF6152)
MRTVLLGFAAIVAVQLGALPAAAHHSFSAVFDRDRPIEVTGTVTKVEWMNPHVWFYIDVENDAGDTESWGFEMGSPNGLIRRGWNHNSLQVGQVVTISGVLARDGTQRGAVRTVMLPNGDNLFGAQNESK